MAIYEDENGLRIESDQELNEDELTQAFSQLSKDAQNSGAGPQKPVNPSLLKMAGESAKNVPEPVKPVDVQDYLSNIAPMTDMSRPGKEDTSKFSPVDMAQDLGLAVGRGIVGWPETLVGIIDIMTSLSPEAISRTVTEKATGRRMPRPDSLGKTLENLGVRFKDARQELDYLMSPDQQAINQGMQDVKGFMDTLQYGIEHPSMILQMVAESVPSMLGGAAIGRGMLKFFPALAPYIAAAIGEGAVSGGQTAEQTRQRIAGGNLDTSQAAVAALSGALNGILGVVGGNLARRFNIVDIDTLLVGGGIRAAVSNEAALAKKGVIRKALESMVEEGVWQEFPQSMQEQMAQNVMEGKPIMDGAIEAGVQGLLTGGAMGFAGGAGGHVMQRYGVHRAQNKLSREMNRGLEAGNIRIIDPEAPARKSTMLITEQGVEAPAMNIEQKEGGTSVAVENGSEVGSYDGDVLFISPDYKGDRVALARQLLQNSPSETSQAGEATLIPQEDNKTIQVNADDFIKARNKSKRPQYLTQYTPKELEGSQIRMIPDKNAGYVIMADGDLVNVFNATGEKNTGIGNILILDAIRNGAKKLDCYDGWLVDFYRKHGFAEVGRERWNEQYRPEGWLDKDKTPDVVYMEYRGESNDSRKDAGTASSEGNTGSEAGAVEGISQLDRSAGDAARGTMDNGQPGPAAVGTGPDSLDSQSLTEKIKAINDTIGEKGSADLTPIIDLGRSVYQQGAQTFERFQARMKELLSDVWDKVEKYIRQAWDVINNESGKVTVKGPKHETLESYARKHRFNFNIPGHSNKEAIENGLFAFVKNDAVGIDKAAEELQGMGLLGETPDEYATAGDYLYDELKKIVANRAQEKMKTLITAEEQAIIEVREELRKDGYNEREIEKSLEKTDRDSQRQSRVEVTDRENRLAEELLQDDVFVSEDESGNATDQGIQRKGETTVQAGAETSGPVQGRSEKEFADSVRQAETQAVTELKQSQTFEEFEKAVFGNANFGDTFNEAPLEKFMSKEELKEYRATGKLNTRIMNLMIERDNLKNMLGRAKTLANDMFRAGRKIGTIEQLEKVREIQALQKEKQADAKEFKNLSNWLNNMEKTIDKKKTIELEHRKVIKEVLAKNADALEVFLLKNEQTGDVFTVPQEQIELLRESRWESTNLVLGDLRNQVSIIKQLIKQGRAMKQIMVANEKFEFMEAVRGISTQIRDLFHVPLGDWNEYLKTNYFKNSEKDIGGLRKEMGHYLRSFMSYLRKGEYIIENLCGYDRMALLYRATFGKATESENTKYRLNDEVAPLIEDAFREIREEWQSGEWESTMTVQTPTGPLEITRHRAVAVGLNSGCEDNRRAMREGIREDRTSDQPSMLSDEAIDAIVAALSPAEKRFINKVWAIFAHQLPALQKAYKEMFGEDMVIVDGIYYPMFFDRDLSNRIANAQANQDLFRQMGTVINVNRGRTITRVGGVEAIDLDVLRFISAIEETNHFIAYGKTVRDINRLISNKAVQDAVKDAIGQEYNLALREWLRRIANPTQTYQGSMKRLDTALGFFRKNAITATLGWGLSTAATQFTAIGITIHRLGFANTMKGFFEFYMDKGWSEIAEWALKASPWLAERVGHTGDLAMAEAIMGTNLGELSHKKAMKKVMTDPKSITEMTKRSFFALITLTDKMITLPTWYTAYQMEFEKSKDHDKAVEFADHETRQCQASTTAKDTATAMAGGNIAKSFTMFQSYFNQQFNEMVRDVDLVKHGKIGYIDLMRSYAWMILFPAIIQAMIKARGWYDDKDKDKKKLAWKVGKDIGTETIGTFASSVPILGAAINAWTGGFEFRPTPVVNLGVSAGKAIASGGKSLKTKRAFYGKSMPTWMREGGLAIGYIARLPSRQVMRTAEEAWDAYHKGHVSWKNAYGMIYKERKKEK